MGKWCQKHYERSRRRGFSGETRSDRELIALAAKERRRQELVAFARKTGTDPPPSERDAIFGPYAKDDEGDDDDTPAN